MKMDKLITLLKQYNPSAEVTTPTSEDICISYIDQDGKFTEKTTPQVFIEPSDICPLCIWHDEDYCNYHTDNCDFIIGCEAFNRKGE